LAFANSRKAVERIVAATHRGQQSDERGPLDDSGGVDAPERDEEELDAEQLDEQPTPAMPGQRILPYRAGYETEDRLAIQRALTAGELVGVVSTSALELGLDIGDIDLVVLLDVPPTVKAFWQRIGRAGRRNPAVCLMFDPRGRLAKLGLDLAAYLERPMEPNWLYLDNRYIQYANVLCAAVEISGGQIPDSFKTLPPLFVELLENELNPQQLIPADLYQLKQRGQNDPHHEFALRGAVEQSFKIRDRARNLGEVTLAQALREAYPGAIYLYMARPYRINGWYHRNSVINARRAAMYTTHPINQTMVFPRFDGGILTHLRSASGFIVEADMQVSERVTGFSELRGPNRVEHRYGPGSPYAQRELYRFFETTGVCWLFEPGLRTSEETLDAIRQTFAAEFGIQERDLGYGYFHSNVTPRGTGPHQGDLHLRHNPGVASPHATVGGTLHRGPPLRPRCGPGGRVGCTRGRAPGPAQGRGDAGACRDHGRQRCPSGRY
jgi:DEAD/DEAH box helicase domain-containing protein